MIKYRMLEVSKKGEWIEKLPSKMLPAGLIQLGNRLLHNNGILYEVTNVSVDLELYKPEVHVELVRVKED
jgi:hypothetical protein